MKITMSNDEVQTALIAAMQAKIEWNFGEVTPENSFPTVKTPDGEVDDIEGIEFTVVL